MHNISDHLLSDPFFLTGWLESVPGAKDRLKKRLRLHDESWDRLLLCKSPRPQSFGDDIQRIGKYTGANAIILAEELREASAVGSILSSVDKPLTAAARDKGDVHDAPPSRQAKSEIRHLAGELREALCQYLDDTSLDSALSFAWPLRVVELRELSLSSIQSWLLDRGIQHAMHERNREIMGLLLAARGSGLIFVNESLPVPDKKFSMFHEAGHFIFDHWLPRQRILKTEPDLVAVFDGDRPPSNRDQAVSFLRHIEIGLHSHLLDRDDRGQYSVETGFHEDQASAFALEFMAPWEQVVAYIKESGAASLPYWQAADELMDAFGRHFELPPPAARLRALEGLAALHVRPPTINP